MATAHSYIRFSTKDQITGDSTRRQLAATKDYCRNKGLTLSEESYADLGISAFKDKQRASLADMLTAIESGEIKSGDVIILENLDRLSRKGFDNTYEILRSIIQHGVNVVSLSDSLELNESSLSDLVSIVRIALSADLAYKESLKKQERLKAVWAEKQRKAAEDKTPKTTKCPAWLRLSEDRSTYEVVEDKAETVRLIFKLSIQGLGKRKIAEYLNTQAIPHISDDSRSKGVWHTSYVDKILKNGNVLGNLTPTTEKNGKRVLDLANIIEGYYPQIVSHHLFQQANDRIAANRTRSGRKGKRFSNILQGICHCEICGSTMRYSNKNTKKSEQYLSCSKSYIGLCENKFNYRYVLVEDAFVHTLDSTMLTNALSNKEQQESTYKLHINDLEAKLAIIENNIEQLTDIDTIDSQITKKIKSLIARKTMYMNEISELSQRNRELEKQTEDALAVDELKARFYCLDSLGRANFNASIQDRFRLTFTEDGIVKFKLSSFGGFGECAEYRIKGSEIEVVIERDEFHYREIHFQSSIQESLAKRVGAIKQAPISKPIDRP